MKNHILKVFLLSSFSILSIASTAQTLYDYINEAKRNYIPSINSYNLTSPKNTTQIKFGYFINPQYTISGAQRSYVQIQQEIPWLGKNYALKKLASSNFTQNELQKQYEIEQLGYQVKVHYYKMYQYQKQKEIYVKWSEQIRAYIADTKKDSLSADKALQQFEYETQLIETTKQLQIVDGDYQNEVIVFNELIRSENLDEPRLPVWLAMPEEDTEYQFPDPFESASYKKYEHQITQLNYTTKMQNPWNPTVSLGLRYINVTTVNTPDFGLPNRDIFEPQLQLSWSLFSKRPSNKLNTQKTDDLLNQKIRSLSRQLQVAINEQISARIAYDAATQKIESLQKIESQYNFEKNTSNNEKKLQINSLKYTFELQQIKAVASYYTSTAKMLLFF